MNQIITSGIMSLERGVSANVVKLAWIKSTVAPGHHATVLYLQCYAHSSQTACALISASVYSVYLGHKLPTQTLYSRDKQCLLGFVLIGLVIHEV